MAMIKNESFDAEDITKKEISNPHAFLEIFRGNDVYKEEFTKFFKGKQLSNDVTEMDKTKAFESNETGRKTLINFAKNSNETLVYSPSEYSEKFQEAVSYYFDHLSDFHKGRFADKDALGAFDTMRGQYHDSSAKILAQDFGISHKIARGLVQIMSINKGLETFDSVGQDERKRLLATLN